MNKENQLLALNKEFLINSEIYHMMQYCLEKCGNYLLKKIKKSLANLYAEDDE